MRRRQKQQEAKSNELLDQEAMEKRITLEVVIASQVLQNGGNETMRMGKAGDGGVWFKDNVTGTAYRVLMNEDGTCVVAETRTSKKKTPKAKKDYAETHVTITCIEEGCGAEREIATQDAHQVKRCVPCQKAFRARKRSERAKAVRTEKRKARELEQLNTEPKPEPEPVPA